MRQQSTCTETPKLLTWRAVPSRCADFRLSAFGPVADGPSRDSRAHLPKYLSSDHDPLYRFHLWEANLRILEVTEIKTVPYVPLSHPFVERRGGLEFM